MIGILPGQASDSLLRMTVPISSAEAAMVPSEWPRAPTLLVTASHVEEVEAVRSRVEQWLAAQDPGWPRGVTLTNNTARAKQARQGVLVFKLAMGAITGISLLVGGIGIMNVLLASVAERTREIGIRKATGARHRDILGQFLAESVAITAAGSIVGVLLGLALAFSITAIIRAQTEATMYAGFTWGTVAVAVIASVTVGLVFGMYPALRAARLSPIDAIRHE
jgi:putative ABC transport system permease protein